MTRTMRGVATLLGVFTLILFQQLSQAQTLSDKEIRENLIQKSIVNYPGNCPCPYNTARNGSQCGGRSAWSRSGGYAPLCYDSDVSDEMVQNYKETH